MTHDGTVSHPFRPDATHSHLCGAQDENPLNRQCGRPERDHAPAGRDEPVTAMATPEQIKAATAEGLPVGWQYAAAPPEWVLDQNQTATGWRNVGERRWRADLPEPVARDLLLVVNTAGTGFLRFALHLDYGGPMNGEVIDRTFTDMQDRLDHEALPECVAPGCTKKGVMLFVAAELGHLAGRVVAAGDEIRMCQPHAYDVYRAGEGLDAIAAWLRPDAEILDPWLIAQYRYYGAEDDYIHRTRARLPRMLRPAGDPT